MDKEKDIEKTTEEVVNEEDKVQEEAPQEEPAKGKKEKALKRKIEDLEKEKKDLETKLADSKNDYLRLMAEFENFRRRTSAEKLDMVASAASDTIKGLLPIVDDFERALDNMASLPDDDVAKQGTSLIYNKLIKYLNGKGLEKIEAKGEKFDTDLHEAVAQFPVEDEKMKGCVYDVVENGYKLGGKILRYAKVVVGI